MWTPIGKVTAAGNSNVINNYSYADDVKIFEEQNIKTIYYRLKQVDKDGATVNSNIIALSLKSKLTTITLYPLPINNILNAVSSNAETITQINILDLSGKQVITSNSSQVDLTRLAQGMYIVKVLTETQTYYQKITK